MTKERKFSQSLEDYLETILELQVTHTVARSKDIAEKLDIKRGSVTGMLKKMAAQDLINYEPYGFVTLTPKGEKIAKQVTTRHNVFRHFLFKHVKLDETVADEVACRMEHTMTHATFAKFQAFVKQLGT